MCGRVTKKGIAGVRLGLGLRLGAEKYIDTTLSDPKQFSESKVRYSQNGCILKSCLTHPCNILKTYLSVLTICVHAFVQVPPSPPPVRTMSNDFRMIGLTFALILRLQCCD